MASSTDDNRSLGGLHHGLPPIRVSYSGSQISGTPTSPRRAKMENTPALRRKRVPADLNQVHPLLDPLSARPSRLQPPIHLPDPMRLLLTDTPSQRYGQGHGQNQGHIASGSGRPAAPPEPKS
ncbi:hypothetical protein CGLO_07822 [Colletotrichum gloeosporioides Cg-14]|uniref:Uncharacterized protein n=1 Tax=Colletotrichum gloeosporioides (strain Cg-14) TaxID=1237896 RepID=T0LW10_COLGC|nr:hypothetical protein CGLO_07822 [Colletotrichum gloeosporioides Cg-14]